MGETPRVSTDLSDSRRALLDALLAERGLVHGQAIQPRAGVGSFPLSYAQRQLWFLDQLGLAGAAYIIPASLELGAVDETALQIALDHLIVRHAALRTTFPAPDGEPLQRIADHAPVTLQIDALTDLPSPARDQRLAAIAAAEASRPFDLATGPLLRVRLVRISHTSGRLFFTVHHIVADAWSVSMAFRELTELYASAVECRPHRLPALPITYADFSAWQHDRLQGSRLQAELDHWRVQLAGLQPLELPTDRPRGQELGRPAGTVPVSFGPAETRALRRLAGVGGTSLLMTVVAALAAVLGRLSGQDDIPIGIPVANRDRPELEGIFGFLVNTLVLRCDVGGRPTFTQLLERIRGRSVTAYSHAELPFEVLVQAVAPPRDAGRTPLIDVFVQVFPDEGAGRWRPQPNTEAKFDLYLMLWETPSTVEGLIEYRRDLFDETTIARLAARLELLVGMVSAAPNRIPASLDLLVSGEPELLAAFGTAESEYPRDATVPELFRQVAEATPDAVALAGPGGVVSYGDLERRSNGLAHRLRAAGVSEQSFVGVFLDRSASYIEAVLAVLKAGGAYVPLDPGYPEQRIQLMAAETDCTAVITTSTLAQRMSAFRGSVVRLDIEDIEPMAEPPTTAATRTTATSPAYVMFTSGSSGRPKGVLVTHRGIIRLTRGANYAQLTRYDVTTQLAPNAFDAATFEIWATLLNGATLVLPPPGPLSLEEIGDIVRGYGVSTMWLTTGLFDQMIQTRAADLIGVRRILTGGDVMSPNTARRALELLPGCRVVNLYGPTENTTFTTWWPMDDPRQVVGPVPIGRPVSNTRVYVVDGRGGLVPVGVPGELCVAGDGVALGYVGLPALSAERFVVDRFGGGGRMYRTGDRVRWRSDGVLEFLGRLDDQVKIRGFRVEPGEVQGVLLSHPGVAEAVVVAREDVPGDRRLVGYVVPGTSSQAEPDLAQTLLAFVRGLLPEFLVPTTVVIMSALPLSPSGKLDRAALPAPESSRRSTQHVVPRTPLEADVCKVISGVLGGRPVGPLDGFFSDLGGHSLLATQVISRLCVAFGVALPLRTLFDTPTAAGVAAAIEDLVIAEVAALDDAEVLRRTVDRDDR